MRQLGNPAAPGLPEDIRHFVVVAMAERLPQVVYAEDDRLDTNCGQ